MPYFRKRNYKKPATTPRATPRKNYRKKMPMQSFAKRVNNIIARNIENKLSTSVLGYGPIVSWSNPSTTPTWYVNQLGGTFNVSQGLGQGDRIGNTIKLKRWVVKGQLIPALALPPVPGVPSSYMDYSYQGQATVMLIKLRNDVPVPSGLDKLFQDGNATLDPLGATFDKLRSLNKDLYKVYWRRTFKLGTSNTAVNANLGAVNIPMFANNDYQVTATFGLDICKYIGKNAKITYDDANNIAIVPSTLSNLALAVIWSPLTDNLYADPTQNISWYNVNMTNYYEFEDA